MACGIHILDHFDRQSVAVALAGIGHDIDDRVGIDLQSASNGTIARSLSSRIDTTRRPFGYPSARCSSSICIAIAVEVRTNPVPAKKLGATG